MESIQSAFIEAIEPRLLFASWYVDQHAVGAEDGKSWKTAFRNVQPAIDSAASGSVVLVADGIYKPTFGSGRDATFHLKNGVNVVGGFFGYGGPPSQKQNVQFRTTLSGDIGVSNVASDNAYHVVTAAGTGATSVLYGCTVTGGQADGTALRGMGGGVISDGGTITLVYCTVQANTATDGGGCFAQAGRMNTYNCAFVGNVATGNGGAINCINSEFVVICSTVTANTATSAGGAMYLSNDKIDIFNSIAWNDLALEQPGASEIFAQGQGTPSIGHCDVKGGVAGIGNLNVDPRFVRNPNVAIRDYGNLRLQANSPLIDVGDNDKVDSGILTDLGNATRLFDYPNLVGGGAIVDIGAFEAFPPIRYDLFAISKGPSAI